LDYEEIPEKSISGLAHCPAFCNMAAKESPTPHAMEPLSEEAMIPPTVVRATSIYGAGDFTRFGKSD
jgi:hypothetical protein